MKLYDKVKWILGITMIFVLIVSTNLIDRNNFVRVKDSVESIYADRLIAKEVLYEVSKAIHEKELMLSQYPTKQNDPDLVPAKNKHLLTLLSQFEKTKMTTDEVKVFDGLKSDINDLLKLEELLENESKVTPLHKKITSIKIGLDDLSQIQINEASRQLSISRQAVDTVELFTHIEIYLLVILGIIIQVIVMYNPKKTEEL